MLPATVLAEASTVSLQDSGQSKCMLPTGDIETVTLASQFRPERMADWRPFLFH